jgi:4-amino-4-deoxy-L-arabinose transferase-like glycosyltransferase
MSEPPAPIANTEALLGLRWWVALAAVLVGSLLVLGPTTGDFGLTYDEPAYRFSQHRSGLWWEQTASARTVSDLRMLAEADSLIFHWPYAMHGINFHPPLAGQCNLLTFRLLGGYLNDTVARRSATVIEFALTITIIFGFLSKRYGAWVGAVAALSLLLMPRLYGQAHLMDTDIPGLLIWVASALTFWKSLYEHRAGAWRVIFGVLLGLAFLEKMATVVVLIPVLLWMAAAASAKLLRRELSRVALLDGLVTLVPMLASLGLAFAEILRLEHKLPEPRHTNLFVNRPASYLPSWLLAAPLIVWLARKALSRLRKSSLLWGRERPLLETLAALLAFAPLVAWVGNPLWWQETFTRLAHYYTINANRKGSLPNIQILYFGQIYEFSAPWPNAWVLLAITVPIGILVAGVAGIGFALFRLRSDRLPLYFVIHLLTLPVLRMLPTPAHDGVRLFLPTFAFLACLSGLGLVWVSDGIARVIHSPRLALRGFASLLVLGTAAYELAAIHPYELSYYNQVIGGPRGAWQNGFELSYWYDAFTPQTIAKLNQRLPVGAHVGFPNDLSAPATFSELQSLGELRGDLHVDTQGGEYPYLWLLTHDSKAMAYSRLLFALAPWYHESPTQLNGLRVLTVASPRAAARAVGLWLLTDDADRSEPDPPSSPDWVRRYVPFLGRLWGDGLEKVKRLATNEPLLKWARHEPESLRASARVLVAWAKQTEGSVLSQRSREIREWLAENGGRVPETIPKTFAKLEPFNAQPRVFELYATMVRYDEKLPFSSDLLKKHPNEFLDAIQILCARPDEVRRVLQRYSYTDPDSIGGYLDSELPHD